MRQASTTDKSEQATRRFDVVTRSATDDHSSVGNDLRRSPRMLAQERALHAAFGPTAQRMRIRLRGKTNKYECVDSKERRNGDVDTEQLNTIDEIDGLMHVPMSMEVELALLKRKSALQAEDLQSSQVAINNLKSQNTDVETRLKAAIRYLKEDDKSLSRAARVRQLVIPAVGGAMALISSPVNAFKNTATLVDVTLATAAIGPVVQVLNDAEMIWSAENNWRRGYLVTALVCQSASQMLMAAPGTDDPLFQAPPQNDTLAGNSTAPIDFTGSYDGNKWFFLAVGLLLGLVAVVFRLLDVREADSIRKKESKRRLKDVQPGSKSPSTSEDIGGNDLNEII